MVIGGNMVIRCKKSHRFLCEVDIEAYIKNLEKLGICQELPLEITIPCRNCKEIEVYEVYKTHYKFKKKLEK